MSIVSSDSCLGVRSSGVDSEGVSGRNSECESGDDSGVVPKELSVSDRDESDAGEFVF